MPHAAIPMNDASRVGDRERAALAAWRNALRDVATLDESIERVKRIVPGSASAATLATFEDALATSTYDPYSDAITWRGVRLTIEQIDALVNEQIGALAGAENWTPTHAALHRQLVLDVESKHERHATRIERGHGDDEDRAAEDYYRRALDALRRLGPQKGGA